MQFSTIAFFWPNKASKQKLMSWNFSLYNMAGNSEQEIYSRILVVTHVMTARVVYVHWRQWLPPISLSPPI